MNSKAIIAILAVVVVVAAGAGVVVLTHNNSHHETLRNSNNLDGRLTVFGNANNDDFLDSRDVDYVKKVIAGEEKATYYTCYKTYRRFHRPKVLLRCQCRRKDRSGRCRLDPEHGRP